MENEEKIIVLQHVRVIFSELQDKGYGRSITIDATDPAIQKLIKDWVKRNSIGTGEAKFKEYTSEKDGKTTIQYNFKLSEYTQISGKTLEDKTVLGEKDLGYDSIVNLQARAYEYENKFGKGISASLDGIFVVEPAKNTVMANIAE